MYIKAIVTWLTLLISQLLLQTLAYSAETAFDLFGRTQLGDTPVHWLRFTPRVEWDGAGSLESLKVFTEANISHVETDEDTQSRSEINRAWLRFSRENMSLRIGRQKVNFGPTRVLRALQWFDQINTTDLIPFTRGVDGILLKLHGENTQSLWLWVFQDPLVMSGLEPFAHQIG